MKRILLPLFAVFVCLLSANAQKEGDLVLSAKGVKKISFGEDMNVVLLKASENHEIQLSQGILETLDVSFTNGLLALASRRKNLRETVYLLIDEVDQLTLGQNTTLTSSGIIDTRKLDLYVHDGARARLLTRGKVNAYAAGSFGLDVKINPVKATSTAAIRYIKTVLVTDEK